MPSRIWKAARRAILGLLVLIILSICGGLLYRAYRHHQLARATVIDPARGIDEALFTRIGGIDQWIVIRGQDRDNPVLLLLHGGPGIAMSPLPRHFLFSWTKDFTIVFWDQRGAGKTYGRSGPVNAGVTKDRMAQDGLEVAQFVRTRLHKPTIVIVGLSWGTTLGVRMALARPDLFSAYVGSGQSVDQGKFRRLAYDQLLAEARMRSDREAVAELEVNGPPPYDSIAKARVHTKWANRYEPGLPSTASLISMVLFDSRASLGDLRDFRRGLASSQDHFRDAVEKEDIPSLGTTFAMPFFVFQGALDNVTPVGPVREYVDRITAPRKELVLIPNAGHNAIATRSDEFLKLLLERVLPDA
ncbi:MAG TPA: alpha/beta hydrolase [Vicinamibacterales bacterium]|jgi:pimeloyl-ACP methyl ester carboxylesterase|nr:alpha/beta hydrolase [Vicinamibacterales bacterium]